MRARTSSSRDSLVIASAPFWPELAVEAADFDFEAVAEDERGAALDGTLKICLAGGRLLARRADRPAVSVVPVVRADGGGGRRG